MYDLEFTSMMCMMCTCFSRCDLYNLHDLTRVFAHEHVCPRVIIIL